MTATAPVRRRPPTATDPATAYARAVLAGKIVAGQLVRLACERHLRDLEHGAERGLVWRPDKAKKAIDFFGILKLPDGPGAGEPFVLLPWQQFVVGSLFGWYGGDGRRRFHYALVEVARANGKSPLAAGIGLYMLAMDGETGAQVYSAATTRDQAKIVFNDAVAMAEKSPSFWPLLTKTVNNLAFLQLRSYLRPLAAEASTMDGLRVHGAMVDELHEHPNGEVLAKLRTGMKSSQPLLFMITTAGYDRHSVCYDEHEQALKVLEGVIENDTYFAFIATLDIDAGDDWTDESCWPKSNPSLGTTVRIETLRDECELAKQIPGQQNSFKRLRLNVWTESSTRWLDLATWDRNAGEVDAEELKPRPCFAGADLSSTTDLTALELYFPDDDGGGDWLHFYFVPEENLHRRAERDRVPYDVWAEQGLLTATPGNVVDYDYIREKLNELVDEGYTIQEIAYDPWNATQLVTDLTGDSFTCVPMRQGFASLTSPTKEFEKLLLAGKFRGLGHPVARWAASNVTVEQDAAGNLKPSKAKSTERIDPIVAMIMALDRAIRQPEPQESEVWWT